jgi:thiamine biosynthesis lipoprotein
MGMPIGIDLCDTRVPEQAFDRAFQWLRFVDRTFSTYRDDSEISRINRGDLGLLDAHPGVRSVLDRCERLRAQTRGYFDIRVGPGSVGGVFGDASVDPSGLVKGWAVAGAAHLLRQATARNYCVNAGGDLAIGGVSWDGAAWRVGIQHPRERDQVAAVLAASDVGIATSGAYERGAHIVDPHTGAAPSGVQSVTVVGPDVANADVFATAAYAMGPAGAEWCASLPGYAAMVILDDDTVLSTIGMDRYRIQDVQTA